MGPLLHQHMVPQHGQLAARGGCSPLAPQGFSAAEWRQPTPRDPDWQQLSGLLGTQRASLSFSRTWNRDLLLAKHHSTLLKKRADTYSQGRLLRLMLLLCLSEEKNRIENVFPGISTLPSSSLFTGLRSKGLLPRSDAKETCLFETK